MKIQPCKSIVFDEKLAASTAFEEQRQIPETAPITPGTPEVRVVQEVRFVGIGRFACWWFVILSFIGIIAFALSR